MKKSIYFTALFIFLLPLISYSQPFLQLASCDTEVYPVNDNSDSDGDGIICEAKITLSNSASYTDGDICQLSNIKWTVLVDLGGDGTNDIEYSSSLPPNDDQFDDTNNNGIPDIYIPMTLDGEDQNILLPDIEGAMSNHKVRWLVSDDCDLGDLCVTSFTVEDQSPPTPFCLSLVTVPYDGSDVTIYAEDFNLGAFDYCTDTENLRYSFSGDSIVPTRAVTCDDVLNSPVELNVYVWDESDNTNFCIILMSAVATSGADCISEEEIGGMVRGWDGNPIVGVEVTLDANAAEFPKVEFTDEQGQYSFGVLDGSLEYKLSASLDEDDIDGVSTLDLVIIQRHILDLESFTNPYQIIASDMSGDKAVKANDLVTLRKFILGVITELPTSPSWKFLRSDFEFEDPSNPFGSLMDFDEDPFSYEFSEINSEGYDFIGLKVGNVNN